MPNSVFYSWQQDTPSNIGESFIEEALKEALKELHADITLDKALRELQLDRDTENVPGQPPIADTILRKIDAASVYVPDLTFVGTRLDRRRRTPNPNVLIEYGYAVKALTHERIVPVMNTYYGEPSDETIPFDMKHLRHPIQFRCDPSANPDERKDALDELTAKLKEAITAVITALPSAASAGPFIPALTRERFRSENQPIGETVNYPLMQDRSSQVTFADGSAVWFKIEPAIDSGRKWKVTEILKEIQKQISTLNEPLQFNPAGYLRASDGIGLYAINANNPDKTQRVVFVSTNGELLAIVSDVIGNVDWRGQKIIPDMTQIFVRCLKSYSKVLMALGISPPFKWQATVEDTQDLPMVTQQMHGISTLSNNCLETSISVGGDYKSGDDPVTVLRPFTEKLYDSCGLPPPRIEPYSAP